MSKVLENIKKQASLLGKHIVLPEGEDARVVKAAAEAVKEGIAKEAAEEMVKKFAEAGAKAILK